MVEGLTIFRDRFRGLEDCYVLIGGTACDLWMGERALDFRATKDLDMVLVVEALRPEFFQVFWQFVKDAGYEGFGGGQEPRNFYRFKKPAQAGFPWMIELFSRRACPRSCSMMTTTGWCWIRVGSSMAFPRCQRVASFLSRPALGWISLRGRPPASPT